MNSFHTRCGNYSRVETIQGRKLYEGIPYSKTFWGIWSKCDFLNYLTPIWIPMTLWADKEKKIVSCQGSKQFVAFLLPKTHNRIAKLEFFHNKGQIPWDRIQTWEMLLGVWSNFCPKSLENCIFFKIIINIYQFF